MSSYLQALLHAVPSAWDAWPCSFGEHSSAFRAQFMLLETPNPSRWVISSI